MKILSGRRTVPTTTEAVRLTDASMPVRRVTVYAIPTNTSVVHIGDRGVNAEAGYEDGYILRHNDRETFHDIDLSDIWVAVKVADEGVTWGAVVER